MAGSERCISAKAAAAVPTCATTRNPAMELQSAANPSRMSVNSSAMSIPVKRGSGAVKAKVGEADDCTGCRDDDVDTFLQIQCPVRGTYLIVAYGSAAQKGTTPGRLNVYLKLRTASASSSKASKTVYSFVI